MGGTPAKTALGRGLRRLMRGPGEPKRNGSPAAAPSITPGVARLLRGGLDAFEEPPSAPGSADGRDAGQTKTREVEVPVQTTFAADAPPTPVSETGVASAPASSGPDRPTSQTAPRPQNPPLPTFGANEVVAWRRLVQGSLIGADVLLVGIAGWLAFSPSHPFGLLEGLICVVALLTGCWLTALALFLEP